MHYRSRPIPQRLRTFIRAGYSSLRAEIRRNRIENELAALPEHIARDIGYEYRSGVSFKIFDD